MINNFSHLCEAVSTTLKQTKILRYPKQIQLSEEFMKALSKEVAKHVKILDESQSPIKDFPEKFLKALRFELVELTEKKLKTSNQMDMKPRQSWSIKPTERIHGQGKKTGYNRALEKRKTSKED